MLEFDLKPRSITTVTDLGCGVLPSLLRSLSDRASISSHPNKAVDIVPRQNFEKSTLRDQTHVCVS
jgi:hypothetical protein